VKLRAGAGAAIAVVLLGTCGACSSTPSSVLATFAPAAGSPSTSALATDASVINSRLAAIGVHATASVSGESILVKGSGPAISETDIDILGSNAQLFFRPVLAAAPPYVAPKGGQAAPKPLYATNALVSELNLSANEQYKFTSAGWSAGATGEDSYTPPAAGAWPLLASYQSTPPDQDFANVPVILDGTSTGYGTRLLLGAAAATGTIVDKASASHSSTGQWVVVVTLTGPGTATFNAMATEYYHTLVANDLGGEIQSAPIIDATNFDSGVSITGGGPSGFTQSQANSLAIDLSDGALAVPLLYSGS
jgi:hypothetical protein